LLGVVEHVGERVVGSVGPDGVKVLVRASAKEQGGASSHTFSHHTALHRIGVHKRPTAVPEAVTAILVRPARCMTPSRVRLVKAMTLPICSSLVLMSATGTVPASRSLYVRTAFGWIDAVHGHETAGGRWRHRPV